MQILNILYSAQINEHIEKNNILSTYISYVNMITSVYSIKMNIGSSYISVQRFNDKS